MALQKTVGAVQQQQQDGFFSLGFLAHGGHVRPGFAHVLAQHVTGAPEGKRAAGRMNTAISPLVWRYSRIGTGQFVADLRQGCQIRAAVLGDQFFDPFAALQPRAGAQHFGGAHPRDVGNGGVGCRRVADLQRHRQRAQIALVMRQRPNVPYGSSARSVRLSRSRLANTAMVFFNPSRHPDAACAAVEGVAGPARCCGGVSAGTQSAAYSR